MLPSLRDRLLLVEEHRFDVLDNYDLDELKQDIRRSLEQLLNTRRNTVPCGSSFENLRQSIYYYGVPDFSELGLGGNETVGDLLDEIRLAIMRFEPRLKNVTVEEVEPDDGTRILQFRVHGYLATSRERLGEVEYDSSIAASDSSVEVNLRPR